MSFPLDYFHGFLFDFDGTLADTEPLHQVALQEFFKKKKCVFGKKEAGKSTLHIFQDWGKDQGQEALAKEYLQEYLAELPQFFHDHLAAVDWHKDGKKLIEKTKNLPRVLTTGSYLSWLKALDPKLRIFEKFEYLVTKDDVLPDHEKPDPLAYQLAAQRLNLPPQKCVAFEDSYSGVLSADKAGCFVVAVKRDSVRGFEQADIIVDSLEEVL